MNFPSDAPCRGHTDVMFPTRPEPDGVCIDSTPGYPHPSAPGRLRCHPHQRLNDRLPLSLRETPRNWTIDEAERHAARTFCLHCPFSGPSGPCETEYQRLAREFDPPPEGVWAGKTTAERKQEPLP